MTDIIPLIRIRRAQSSDVPALANLYRQSVLATAPQAYTPEQTTAWAAFATDFAPFQRFILGVTTYVAIAANEAQDIVGFAGIGATGHVASVYVHPDRARQGIGSLLMQRLLTHAHTHRLPRLYAEASEFSLGLFQKFGFRLYDTEVVVRQGVPFTRYLVEYWLETPA